MSAESFGAAVLKEAFGTFVSGVVALAAVIDGSPVGMAASSFTSVSIDPPLVSVCASTGSATWAALRSAPRLGVSVLSRDHDLLCRQLAGPARDRFHEVEWEVTEDGAVFLHRSLAYLDCEVDREIEAGDHWIVVLRIKGIEVTQGIAPLVFHASRFKHLAD